MLVFPIRAEPVGDILDDLPVRASAVERLKHLIQPLNSPLGAGERALFFKAGSRGQHHVGELAGLAEENVLNDEELELAERVLNVIGVGVDYAHFLANDI